MLELELYNCLSMLYYLQLSDTVEFIIINHVRHKVNRFEMYMNMHML